MGASTITELKHQVHHTIKILQDSFQNLAALLNPAMADQLKLLGETYCGSQNPLTADVIRLTEDEKEQIRRAVLLRRESVQTLEMYLKVVDSHDANGSVQGLPPPNPHSGLHGGVSDRGVPLPIPPKQPVEDVSRDRIRIFLELLPEFAMAELQTSDGILDLRWEWIDSGGHATGRHDMGVSSSKLSDRAVNGHDPMTGTKVDWQTGRTHGYSAHATAFTSREALVYTEAKVWVSKEAEQARALAEGSGARRFEVRIPALQVLGPDFRQYVHGETRIGSRSSPQGSTPTAFTNDATIFTQYRRDSPKHPWRLNTCYTDPEG